MRSKELVLLLLRKLQRGQQKAKLVNVWRVKADPKFILLSQAAVEDLQVSHLTLTPPDISEIVL